MDTCQTGVKTGVKVDPANGATGVLAFRIAMFSFEITHHAAEAMGFDVLFNYRLTRNRAYEFVVPGDSHAFFKSRAKAATS